jgi:hypothetical protein
MEDMNWAVVMRECLREMAKAGIATPERGYMVEPMALPGDIARLAAERDDLAERLEIVKAQRDALRAQAERLAGALRALLSDERTDARASLVFAAEAALAGWGGE